MTLAVADVARAPAAAAVPERPEVSVLSVAYNSRDYIVRCLETVIAHTQATGYELLLVDNGTDGSGALVAEALPQVRVIPGRGNIGFGAANNLLARHAEGELLLLLNPDTYLEADAIDRLVAFARATPQAVAWAGRMVTPAGLPDGGTGMPFPTLLGFARASLGLGGGRARRAEAAAAPHRAGILHGGFMLIRRDTFAALGGFDESFFLYSEEVDLFARLAAAGHQAWVTPDSVVVHDVGSGEVLSRSRILFKTRGQMHYLRKHWPTAKAAAAGAMIWAQAAQRALRGAMLGRLVPRWRELADAYGPIALRPASWWRGYAGGVHQTRTTAPGER